MTDPAPARILATPAADTYFGPGVINFLNQTNRLTSPTVVATPGDFSQGVPSQAFQSLISSTGASSPGLLLSVGSDLRHGASIAYRTLGDTPVGITVLGDNNSSPQRVFNEYAGLPPNTPNSAPGSLTDWRSMLLFHEQGHHAVGNAQLGRDRKDRGGPFDELQAERAGRDLYTQALQAGVVRDPGVPDALSAARLINAMLRPAADKDYAASSLLNTPLRADMDRPGNTGTQSITETQDGINGFKRAVYAEAVRMEDPRKYDLIRAQAMHDSLKAAPNPQTQPLQDLLKNLLDRAGAGKWGALKDISEFMAQMPPDNQDVRNRIHASCITEVGYSLDSTNRNSPYTRHLLNAAVAVRDSGQLAGDAAGLTAANSFINAARTYIPGYFKDNAPGAPASKVGPVTQEVGQTNLQDTYQELMARPTVAQLSSQTAPVSPVTTVPNDPAIRTQIKPAGQA